MQAIFLFIYLISQGVRRPARVFFKRWVSAIMMICAVSAFNPLIATSAESQVVARVNGEPIIRAQLERMKNNPLTMLQTQRELGVEEPDDKELEHQALRKLIHQRLMVEEAHRRQITITQEELDEAVASLRRQFVDLASFGLWVKEQGLNDPELFASVRTDMLASRASAALVEDVEVTVQQVQEYFEEHREDLIIGAEVRLRIIAVREKGEADKILAELQQGKNFTRLAAKHSRGKLASRGGDTGWVDFRKLPPLLQEAVGRLKIGDVAGPLEKSTDEYLLLGLQDRRPLRAKSLEEAQPEIERRLLAEERQKVIAAWLEEQETKAKIEVFLEPEKF